MILQSLVRLAEREGLLGDPGFVAMPVHWIVEVAADGRLLGLTYTGQKAPGDKKERFTALPIPKRRIKGGTAVVPDILVDKGQYVFGLGNPAAPEERDRLATCVDAMLAEAKRIADDTDDEAARAQFLAMAAVRKAPDLLSQLWGHSGESLSVPHCDDGTVLAPKRWATNHLFAFRLQGDVVCRRAKVRKWIVAALAPKPADDQGDVCLVTGKWSSVVDNHDPFDLPGDTGRLPLVSFNQQAFEHYGRRGNENAPVSEEAANAYFMALRRLVARAGFHRPGTEESLPTRNLALSADTTVLYWCDGAPSETDPADDLLLATVVGSASDDVSQIDAAYTRPRTGGRPPLIADETPLFTLVLTRAKSRVVLRAADLHTVGAVAGSVMKFMADTAICSRFADERDHRRVRNLIDGTLPASSREATVRPDLATRLYRAAIDSRLPYPRELLAVMVARIRAHDKEGISTRRVALVKAVINRTYSGESSFTKELTVSLEADHPSTAYQLGRLFAVLERAQYEAIKPEAGIAEAFFGIAMTSPALVFGRLLKLSRHHLAKLGGENRGREVNLGRLIDSIIGRVPPTLPRILSLVEQGAFVIGYHHERADPGLYKTPPAPDSPPSAPSN